MARMRAQRRQRARAPPRRRFKATRDEWRRREAEYKHTLWTMKITGAGHVLPELPGLADPSIYTDESLDEALRTSFLLGIRHCVLVTDDGAESRMWEKWMLREPVSGICLHLLPPGRVVASNMRPASLGPSPPGNGP